MRRDFQIIDNLGFVIDDVSVDVEVGTTHDQAAAEARATFETDMRTAYEDCGAHVPGERCTNGKPCEQYKADSVMGSVAEVRWIMPSSYAK